MFVLNTIEVEFLNVGRAAKHLECGNLSPLSFSRQHSGRERAEHRASNEIQSDDKSSRSHLRIPKKPTSRIGLARDLSSTLLRQEKNCRNTATRDVSPLKSVGKWKPKSTKVVAPQCTSALLRQNTQQSRNRPATNAQQTQHARAIGGVNDAVNSAINGAVNFQSSYRPPPCCAKDYRVWRATHKGYRLRN